MNKIVIEFKQEDKEILEALKFFFPDSHKIYEHKGLDGGLDTFIAILTTVDVSLHCIDFFKKYFTDTKPDKSKRFIMSPVGKISLEGYSGEEVKETLGGLIK